MTNTAQNQYIELGNRVVEKIKDFKTLKKENEQLHLDLNKYKSVVLKNKDLIENFKGIKKDLISVIQKKEFDIAKFNYNLGELKEVSNGIKKVIEQNNAIKNSIPKFEIVLKGFSKNVEINNKLIDVCFSEMLLADLHDYIEKIKVQITNNDNILKNQELLIGNSSLISLFNIVQKNLSELVNSGEFNYQQGKNIINGLSKLKQQNITISEQKDKITREINKYSQVLKGYEKDINLCNEFLRYCEGTLTYKDIDNSNRKADEIVNKNNNQLSDIEIVLKNQDLISGFQNIQNEFGYIINNEKFDNNVAKKIFKNLEKINSQIKEIDKNSLKLNEISSSYKNDISNAKKLIDACKSSMKISEIDEYISKFQTIISDLNQFLSGTKDKFSRLSDLQRELGNTQRAWKEDCETLSSQVYSSIEELKNKDIEIEHHFSKFYQIKTKKKDDINYIKENLTGDTYNNFESEINRISQSRCSYSEYENLKTSINQFIFNKNSRVNQKVNKEKAKLIGYGILGLVGLFLFFTFKWYFIVLAILVGAGMFLINFVKTEDVNFDLFENMMTGFYISGGVLVVGSIISAIWWSWVIFISIFFVLLFAGLFTIFFLTTKEIMKSIEISLEKRI